MRTFVMMKDDQSKLVLKQGTVFRLELPLKNEDKKLHVDLWGDMIIVKTKKGKTKANFKERRASFDLY